MKLMHNDSNETSRLLYVCNWVMLENIKVERKVKLTKFKTVKS